MIPNPEQVKGLIPASDFEHDIALTNLKSTADANLKERALTFSFIKVCNILKNDPRFPEQLQSIFEEYNRELVYPISRIAIQETYIIGVDYVNEFLGTQGFLTKTDISKIEQITDEITDSFWRKVIIWKEREELIKTLAISGEPPVYDHLDLNAAVTQTAVTAITYTLKTATMTKIESMRDQLDSKLALVNKTLLETERNTKTATDYRNTFRGNIALKTQARALMKRFTTVGERFKPGGAVVNRRAVTTNDIWFIWKAQEDEKACLTLPNGEAGCAFLHNTRFAFDERDQVPTPGGSGSNPTHPYCRCRILIQVGNKTFYGS